MYPNRDWTNVHMQCTHTVVVKAMISLVIYRVPHSGISRVVNRFLICMDSSSEHRKKYIIINVIQDFIFKLHRINWFYASIKNLGGK